MIDTSSSNSHQDMEDRSRCFCSFRTAIPCTIVFKHMATMLRHRETAAQWLASGHSKQSVEALEAWCCECDGPCSDVPRCDNMNYATGLWPSRPFKALKSNAWILQEDIVLSLDLPSPEQKRAALLRFQAPRYHER